MKITLNIPLPGAFARSYLAQVAKEIAQTAVLAGALAGLTAAGNQIPVVSAHYGVSPLLTAQLVALIGSARAFISGLNSAKKTVAPGTPPAAPAPVEVASAPQP